MTGPIPSHRHSPTTIDNTGACHQEWTVCLRAQRPQSTLGAMQGPTPGGGRLQPVLMRHPPSYLQKLAGGGGEVVGGGVGGGVLAAGPGVGGLRATHYYHMHTSRVCVCLWAWRYKGMYAIIAISHPCQEESLKVLRVLRTKGIVPPSTKHGTKFLAPLAPQPLHRYLGGGGGGAGGCRIQGPGPAAPPRGPTQAVLWHPRHWRLTQKPTQKPLSPVELELELQRSRKRSSNQMSSCCWHHATQSPSHPPATQQRTPRTRPMSVRTTEFHSCLDYQVSAHVGSWTAASTGTALRKALLINLFHTMARIMNHADCTSCDLWGLAMLLSTNSLRRGYCFGAEAAGLAGAPNLLPLPQSLPQKQSTCSCSR